jgi:hypothetical protein
VVGRGWLAAMHHPLIHREWSGWEWSKWSGRCAAQFPHSIAQSRSNTRHLTFVCSASCLHCSQVHVEHQVPQGVIITYPYLIHPIPLDLALRTPLVPRTPHTALPPLPARRTQLAVPAPQTCPRRGTPKKEKTNRLQKCSSRHAARSFAARHQ